jgi:hypothetical protein
VLLLTVYIVGGVITHRAAQTSIAPTSVEYVRETAEYLWRRWQPALPFIPAARRDQAAAYLASLNIESWEDYEIQTPRLVEQGRLFRPQTDWLSGW